MEDPGIPPIITTSNTIPICREFISKYSLIYYVVAIVGSVELAASDQARLKTKKVLTDL